MLMALLFAALLGKGGLLFFTDGEIRQVGRVIAEDARAEAVQGAMRRSNEQLEALVGERATAIRAAADLMADPGATRAEVDAALFSLEAAREKALDSYLDTVFEMRDRMSREEWQEAFAGSE